MSDPPHQPEFIIGGAPRSGTTWLYRVLERHPSVYMAKPVQPEPKFFLVDERFELGIDHYLRTWFAEVPEQASAGEKSTNYLESATAAERIYRYLPWVKLIFVLREPADRALSNWRWSRMNGLEDLPFEDALRREAEREASYPPELRYSRPNSYYSRGLYRSLLEPYFNLFPRDQILCLRYEDIGADPDDLAVRVHDFVGVRSRPRDASLVDPVNASDPAQPNHETMDRLRERYVKPNHELEELLGPSFRIWKR